MCCCSVTQSCSTLCSPVDCSTPGFSVFHYLPELAQIRLLRCHLTISSSTTPISFCLQSFPPSGSFPMSQLFASDGQSIRASASASINEYSGLIFFRMDWFDLLAVQGTLKSLLQHHSSKASILWCLAFFMVQLSHPYMTTGKTIALTIQIFVSKAMSLLFNMCSRFVIAFLPKIF